MLPNVYAAWRCGETWQLGVWQAGDRKRRVNDSTPEIESPRCVQTPPLPPTGYSRAMSYYPEHVYYQSTQHDPLAPLAAVPNVVRRCSVKGCSKLLPDAYALKMCDACRGRHRIYANTKRAKRKQEKAAVGAAQPIRACDPLIRSFLCLQRRPTPSLPPTAHASASGYSYREEASRVWPLQGQMAAEPWPTQEIISCW